MINMRSTPLFLGLVLVSLLMLGCTGPAPPVEQPSQPNASGTVSPPPVTVVQNVTPPVVAFNPIKLVYDLPTGMSSGGQDFTLTVWLEKKMECNGRAVLAGVQRFTLDGDSAWSKVIVYTDTGETAITEWTQESGLAFDDLRPAASDFDFYLTVNDIFARGGKNFMTDQSWNSTTPTILRNVVMGSGISNYSIFRTGNHFADKALPCTEFSLLEKGTNVDGTYAACLADMGADMPLPFVVSFEFENEGGPSWWLSSFSHELSGVVSVTQCLEPVRCAYVAGPTSAQTYACEAEGGIFEAIRDDNNCITGYDCLTLAERAAQTIESMQNPSCPAPSQALVNDVADCIAQGASGFDAEYSAMGCITSITACSP